ncbi:MAG: hypothetical protein JKY50_18755 [Oleispira sp.]|nr:hypothetical protein [Oleispira sp.]
MARFTPQQWQELVKLQQQSRLSVTDFCREHTILPKSFYYHQNKASKNDTLGFSQAIIKPDISAFRATKGQTITLVTQAGDLIFPAQISSLIVVDVIKGLLS